MREPDPRSIRLTVVFTNATEDQTKKIKAFKEIIARNPDLTISEELFSRGVESFLRDHNWPPGDSQRVLSPFLDKRDKMVCQRQGCDQEAEYLFRTAHSEPAKKVCETCLATLKRQTRDPYSYMRLKDHG